MKSALVLGAVCLGFVLFLLSLFWTSIFTGEASWTAEKAAELAEVKDRLHNLSFTVNSPEPPRGVDQEAAKAEYAEVKARHEELVADFDSAYDSPRTMATILKWAGIACFALGIVGHFVVKEG